MISPPEYGFETSRFGPRGWRHRAGGASLALLVTVLGAQAYDTEVDETGSGLRYNNQREVAVPTYSTVRIGPFYSSISFLSSVSYRYTRSKGLGTDYLVDGDRGEINEDGSDFPIVLGLDFRNYVPLGRHTDLDVSFRVAYRYFPLNTQEDELDISIPDEQIGATLSTGFELTRYLRGTVYDSAEYSTEYIDERGYEDDYAGQRYEQFRNRVGTSLAWLISPKSDLVLDLSRLDVLVLDNEEEFGNQERVEYEEVVTYERQLMPQVVGGIQLDSVQRDYNEGTRDDTRQDNFEFFLRGSEGGESGFPITDHTTLSLALGGSGGTTYEDNEDPLDKSPDGQRNTTTVNGSATLRTQLSRYLAHSLAYDRGLRGGYNTDFEEYDEWLYTLNYSRPGVGIRVYSGYESVQPGVTDELDPQTGTTIEESDYTRWVSGIALNIPLTEHITLDTSYEYQVIDNQDDELYADPTDPSEVSQDVTTKEDYYERVASIGTSFSLMKNVRFRVFVERYDRLSELNVLEFTRDTFQATLAYTHQF